jgi:hypothetical protein
MIRIFTTLLLALACIGLYAQITVTPNSACAGSTSFQVTITGFDANQIASSACGNITSGGITSNNNIVVNASNFVLNRNTNTITATLGIPSNISAGSYGFVVNFQCSPALSCTNCFTVNAVPSVTLSANPTTICNGQTSNLQANATAGSGTITSYLWNNSIPANSTTYGATPSSTTQYVVTVTNSNNCSSTASTQVTVNQLPNLSPSVSPGTICQGSSATLSANATAGTGTISTYSWSSTLGNVASGSVNPSSTTTYTITATNTANCSASGSTILNVNSRPTVTATAAPSSICNGETSVLFANASAGSGTVSTYSWSSDLGNISGGTVSPGTTTQYTVTVTNSNNCTTSASTSVTVNNNPSVNPTATPGTICAGSASIINANATAGSGTITNYTWSDGLNGNAANGDVFPTSSTIYNVTVTNSNNCSSTGSLSVNVNAIPTVAPTANPSAICNGGSTNSLLNANAGAGSGTITDYQWSSELGNVNSGSVSPSSTTTYAVTVTNSSNCTVSGTVTVGVGSSPTISPTATPSTICQGETSLLEGNGATSSGTILGYAWSSGIVGSSGSGNVSPATNTTYTVTVTNSDNCTASASAVVAVNESPVTAPSTTNGSICEGQSTTIEANASSANETITTYAWSSGIAGNNSGGSVSPTTNTDYTVTVTNSANCTATGSVTINVTPAPTQPVISSNIGDTICMGESAGLSLNTTYDSYLWSNGDTAAITTVNTSGSYIVTVTTSCGTQTSGAFALTVSDPGTPTITESIAIGLIAHSSTAVSYEWFKDGVSFAGPSSDSALQTTTSGNYTVKIVDAAGCDATSSAYTYIGVGIKDVQSDFYVSLAPNPTNSGKVAISSSANGFTATFFDLNGRIVTEQHAAGKNLIADLSNITAGMYIVKIRTNDGKFTTRRLSIQ